MNQPTTAERWSFRRFVPMTEIELTALGSEGKSLASSLLLEPVVQLLLLAAGLQGLIGDGESFYNGHGYIAFVLPGLLVLQALRGFSRTMYRTVNDRQWGMLTIKRLAGAGGSGYAASKIAAPVLALVVQVAVMFGIGAVMGARYGLTHMILASGLCVTAVMFWSALAIIITSFVRDYVTRDIVVTWMMLPLSLAAPVFYTLETAPRYLQWIAALNPLAWQVTAVRAMLLGREVSTATIIMLVLTGLALAGAVVSVSKGDALTSEGGR